MKCLLFNVLLATSLAASSPEWELVWSDEFNGNEIDFTKWAIEEHGHGGGNNELQYYIDRKENVRVEDGNLVIQANKERYEQAGIIREYTSGRIRTKRRASWQYGRFEIKAKLPKGRGIWPAIWLLPETAQYGKWAASGEIDIMELLGHQPNVIHGTLHYGQPWPDNQSSSGTYTLESGDFSEDFHVFALEWTSSEIRWYIDGTLYQKQNQWHSSASPYPAPFDQPFHLILNVAVGGNWAGPPSVSTPFPATMRVDYVKVYQQASP